MDKYIKNTAIIMKKELMTYYTTPIAYFVISIFLLAVGYLFFQTFFIYKQAELRGFFNYLPILFSIAMPAVTMRLFSEEKNTGSFEILMTLPVSLRDVVISLITLLSFTAVLVFIYWIHPS